MRLARLLPGVVLCVVMLPRLGFAQEKSLYLRLGGYDAIAAVTDDMIGRLAADPQLAKFLRRARSWPRSAD